MPRVIPPDPQILERRRRIGGQIQAARLHANLSQQDIVVRSGMDRSAYQDIEHGRTSPLLDTLLRIADVIGVPLADLVREEPRPDAGDAGRPGR
ncbi:helix-turn-helix domain-containing protein [Streptomyces sp. NPDC058220]|uniref:helix-turn-helix domain-containing protein n=1 Tax=Streptomyces sp. NPDC058220 TaxID=3346387 RepID=UPI0036E6B767